jgi:WD40 repeat protein
MKRLLLCCVALLSAWAVLAQSTAPRGRGSYQASREFLQYDRPECFDITRKEADRAFRLRYWDDAMALYRAAKACTDADQNGRAEMNNRIVACRDAARKELLDEQEKAIRQARHATAAKLAGDAREALKRYDRTFAYRLADFANTYIAPPGEDNPECLQALYDACYFVPAVHANLTQSPNLLMPFCYQIDDNLGIGVRVAVAGSDDEQVIYALCPERRQLRYWDAHTLELKGSTRIDSTAHDMTLAAGNRLLALHLRDGYQLVSGRNTYKIKAEKPGKAAFDENGQVFFFVNNYELQRLDTRGLFGQRYTKQSRNRSNIEVNVAPQTIFNDIRPNLLDFHIKADTLWLAYVDSLVQYIKIKEQWIQHRALGFGDKVSLQMGKPIVHLMPQANKVLAANNIETHLLSWNNDSNELNLEKTHKGVLLAASADGQQIAQWLLNNIQEGSKIYMRDASNSDVSCGVLTPAYLNFGLQSGSFAEDNRMFAVADEGGSLLAWSNVLDSTLALGQKMPGHSTLSPDGSMVVSSSGKLLKINYLETKTEAVLTNDFPQMAHGLIANNTWIGFSSAADTLAVVSRITGKQQYFAFNNAIKPAFSADNKYVAYLTTDGQIVVQDLTNPARTFTKKGYVVGLCFANGQDALLAIPGESETQTAPWIWAFGGDNTTRTVRLDNDYQTSLIVAAPSGQYVAFSDGQDIRIFNTDNLLDELTRIRPLGLPYVTAMTFAPDETGLAVGYEDGSVVWWDVVTGRDCYQLTRPAWEGPERIGALAFRKNGEELVLLTESGTLLKRPLRPKALSASLQTEHRQLLSFTPEQIREHNLESAFDYQGNFDSLATSGDLPLIRSFLSFFQEEARNSNNTERVKEYCDRAFLLFEKLDDNTRAVLEPTILDMYEDYTWKLLTRGKVGEANIVIAHLDKHFKNSETALKAKGHAALLSGEWANAAAAYATWVGSDDGTENFHGDVGVMELSRRFRQLQSYDLLTPEHKKCLCGTFDVFAVLDSTFCAHGAMSMNELFPNETARRRWQVFKTMERSKNILHFGKKIDMLNTAWQESRSLSRQHPDQRPMMENATLHFSDALLQQAQYENATVFGLSSLRRAIQVLEAQAPFQYNESKRLEKYATVHYNLVQALMDVDSLEAAKTVLLRGHQIAELMPEGDLKQYISASLWLQQSELALFNGNARAAEDAIERAATIMPDLPVNMQLVGSALLSGDRDGTFLYLGSTIQSAQDLASTMDFVTRMGEYGGRDSIRQFSARFAQFYFNNKETPYDSSEVLMQYHNLRAVHCANTNRWQQTYDHALKAFAYADQWLEKIESPTDDQKTERLNAILQLTYYACFLPNVPYDDIIKITDDALAYARATAPNYPYTPYLYTNLGHAYLLRNQPGDQERAQKAYQTFLASENTGYDNRELLEKDFRVFKLAGVRIQEVTW